MWYNCRKLSRKKEIQMSEQDVPDVGSQLRTLRKQRKLSMRALAELCELSPNTISLIERGATSPSISTLHQLASALKVPITTFFDSPGAKLQAIRSRPGERRFSGSSNVLLESLGSGLEGQTLEPFLVTLEPGADSGATEIVHGGHELVYCLKGDLEYMIEGQRCELTTGDSLLFEANLPHCWRNTSETEPAIFLLIFQSADVGQPLEHHLRP